MSSTRVSSIRARLLVFLLLSAALTALLVGTLSYRRLLKENEELFDYQLRQMALSLRDQGAIGSAIDSEPINELPDSLVQIWDLQGQVVYVSRPGIILPNRATLGFGDLYVGGNWWRVYTVLMRGRVIQVAQPVKVRQDLAGAAAIRSLMPLAAFVPLMALMIWWLVGSSLAPLTRLAAELRQRDAATLDPVSEHGLPSEVAPLALSLNALLARLKRSFERERAFVADAAHELRTPLTALKLQARLCARAVGEDERREAVAQLEAGVERATHLIEQLLTLARSDPDNAPASGVSQGRPVDFTELVREAAADVFPLAQSRSIRLELDAPQQVILTGDAAALRILARNLLDNAVRYTPRNGMVHMSVASSSNEGSTAAALVVEDSGPGIPADERGRVFDRFYRRASEERDDQVGSGLGLAIVKRIADQHRATLVLGDSPLGGLRVSVDFPQSVNAGSGRSNVAQVAP